MKKYSIGFGLVGVLLACAYTYWASQRYLLFAPTTNINDSNFYYLVGALQTWDGSGLVRFAHPGLFFMNLTSWCLVLLRKLNFFSVFTLAEFLQSAMPLRELWTLFVWGKVLSFIQLLLLVMTFILIAQRLTRDWGLALIVGVLVYFQVGMFESIVIIRSENISVLFIAIAFYLAQLLWAQKDAVLGLWLMFAAGVLFQAALSAKILVLFYAPLLGWLFYHFTLKDCVEVQARYIGYSFGFLLLGMLASFFLIQGFDVASLSSIIPARYLAQVTVLQRQLYLLYGCVFAVLSGVAVLLALKQQGRFCLVSRRWFLSLLSFSGGCLVSIYAAAGSAAPHKLSWAYQLTYTAWGQTLFDTFFRRLYDTNTASFGLNTLFSYELIFLLTHFSLLFGILLCGLVSSRGQERKWLALAGAALCVIGGVLSRRGTHSFYYYQVYLLFPAVVILALGLKNFYLCEKKSLKIGFGLIFCVLFAHDLQQIHAYREDFFAQRRSLSAEIITLNTWGWGSFYRQVIAGRYCLPSDKNEVCYLQAARHLGEAMLDLNPGLTLPPYQ